MENNDIKKEKLSFNNGSKVKQFTQLALLILMCQTVGFFSAFFSDTKDNVWAGSLNRPSWDPPSYVFAPVWTILYTLMGIALWLVLKSNTPKPQKDKAVLIFVFQFVLNFAWSILFFKLQSPGFAFVDIALLFVALWVTMIRFGAISSFAAWLLVPYISWVSFAAVLNYTIWTLNQ
jgi:translocator protein